MIKAILLWFVFGAIMSSIVMPLLCVGVGKAAGSEYGGFMAALLILLGLMGFMWLRA